MVAPGGVDLVEVEGGEVELSWTVEPKHVQTGRTSLCGSSPIVSFTAGRRALMG